MLVQAEPGSKAKKEGSEPGIPGSSQSLLLKAIAIVISDILSVEFSSEVSFWLFALLPSFLPGGAG
jgi:hypothetical protein